MMRFSERRPTRPAVSDTLDGHRRWAGFVRQLYPLDEMNIKPLARLTLLLVVLLKVNIGLLLIAVLVGVYQWFEYSHLAHDVDIEVTLLASDVATLVVGLFQIVLTIFLGITFLRWIYRANKNLHALAPGAMGFSPGWSVGWFFIPIANLFKPYQVMKEIWSAARRGLAGGRSLLGWWWCLWIVSNLLGRMALKLALRAKDAQGYTHSAVASVFSDALDIALNIVALMLVTAIAQAYAANYVEPIASPNGGPETPHSDSLASEGPPSVS
jgi:hypothetical protein